MNLKSTCAKRVSSRQASAIRGGLSQKINNFMEMGIVDKTLVKCLPSIWVQNYKKKSTVVLQNELHSLCLSIPCLLPVPGVLVIMAKMPVRQLSC